nr:immunoglobulin light chain junction region [Macaca mulatta]
CQQHGNAPWMF